MRLSYIITAPYNRPDCLRCILASIICQTDQDFEIIVVDNSQNNQFIKEHEELCRTDKRIQYFNPQEKNVYLAMECGWKKAKGDFICFPSDDDYYLPTFGQKTVDAAIENDWDAVLCLGLSRFMEIKLSLDSEYVEPAYAYDPRSGKKIGGYYEVKSWKPKLDESGGKGSYIVKRDKMISIPDTSNLHWEAFGDGFLLRDLISSGICWNEIEEILYVHN